MTEDKDIIQVTEETNLVATQSNATMGFEDAHNDDIVIPRLKLIQAMSQERSDGVAQEGDIINSLTQESAKGKKFVPVKVYYSNIYWNPDRNAENTMMCRSLDGRIGDGEWGPLVCADCRLNQFDNSKVGKEAYPKCTQYINFLGFVEDNPMPVILSFAKTNYNEGKKLLSLAKSMRKSIWAYSYIIDTKKITKDKNSWYLLTARMAGATPAEQQMFAQEMYSSFMNSIVEATYEDTREEDGKVNSKLAEEI